MIFTLEHDDNQICWCGLETSMSLHSWKVTYLLLQWWNSTPGSISHIGSQGCLTAIPNMPNNHNHTGKEGPDAMLPSCYWQLSMIETSEQKLHQRQQVAILSLNASLGSLCATSSWQPPTLSQRTKPRNFAGSSLDTAPFLARLLKSLRPSTTAWQQQQDPQEAAPCLFHCGQKTFHCYI